MKQLLRSLDYTYGQECDTVDYSESLIYRDGEKFSVRGSGTSISANSFGAHSRVIQSAGLPDHMELDEEQSSIHVSANKTLAEVYTYLTPRGYYLKSVPSFPAATIGGCIAYNAHGQNHERDGCFCDHLLSLELFHPDRGSLTLSPTEHSEVFDLTVNGFGLTGIVRNAVLRVYPLRSNRVEVVRVPFDTLMESYELFLKHRREYDFYHAWFELNFISQRRQPGFLEMARITDGAGSLPETIPSVSISRLHLARPVNVFGTSMMRFFCRIYYHLKLLRKKEEMGLFKFMHPSADKLYYFSMFGKQGLIEHQSLIPLENVSAYLDEFVQLLCRYKPVIPLCHTKLFGREARGMSFSGSGYCLAVHVANNRTGQYVLTELDAMDLKYGCITNIAKDSRLSRDTIEQQYGDRLKDFRRGLLAFDPERRFSNRIAEDLYEI